ncbi:MAG: hypothetical protein AVDCRST_MAG67-2175 [uncultured Solirubrobacteraceae bacterium]|uniref:Uncharacterized protein n=1 Tax=uncultured Solirubrobacteraceae bacterium TaxID=1162706 RepID=A0A6J4S134_9ACTN|nr:MAG: hypothetical protein AVDCRST_MAG67-2175 [uncultured Solirubrobacteraceae bacterium]
MVRRLTSRVSRGVARGGDGYRPCGGRARSSWFAVGLYFRALLAPLVNLVAVAIALSASPTPVVST